MKTLRDSALVICATMLLTAVAKPLSAEDAPAEVRVVVIGDSTAASYPKPPKDRPDLTGWGQVLPEFFNKQVRVINHAKSGRSSKSFRAEGWWKKALADKPDYVFIQFGHNDCPGKGDRSTDPKTDFRDYLRKYVKESQEAGATPILVSPMTRRTFHGGQIRTILRPYADATLAVAAEEHVAVIDLHAASVTLFNQLGDQGSADFSASARDRTHFSRKGARAIARLVTERLNKVEPRLAGYLLDRP